MASAAAPSRARSAGRHRPGRGPECAFRPRPRPARARFPALRRLQPLPARLTSSPAARRLAAGALLYGAGLLAPAFLTAGDFAIVPLLHQAMQEADSGALLVAAERLVGLNTARAAPVYLGSLLLAYGVREWLIARGRRTGTARLALLLPVALVPLAYRLIAVLYAITYDFGVPALLATGTIVYLHVISRHTQGPTTQAVILLMALGSYQWLDVAPALSASGFGRGELSTDVKLAAAVLGRERLLNEMALARSALLAAVAVLLARWTVGAAKHLELVQRLNAQRLEAQRARLQAVEDRAIREAQFLVHDLKTPLTAAQGLVSLLRLEAEQGHREAREREHLRRIERILDQMDGLVSQVLHERSRRPVDPETLVRAVRRQLALSQTGPIRWRIRPGTPPVPANLPRLARALVNLITNASAAAGGQGTVEVSVGPMPGAGGLRVRVRDRGPGIPPWAMARVSEPGFSLTGGAGLGLAFVRHVVEETHAGRFRLWSRPGCGTLAVLELPGASGAAAPEEEAGAG